MAGFDEITDDEGRYLVLACDHRDSLRLFLSPDDPDSVPAQELTDIKIDLARVVSPYATGMLLDPEYGVPQVTDAGALADGVGVIMSLESQGYLADPVTTVTTVMDGWSAQQAADAGASAAKVLLPYHPARETAAMQEMVLREMMASCRAAGLPLVVEPVAFVYDDPAEHTEVVIETVGLLDKLMGGPDEALFKLPFPGLASDPGGWAVACQRVSDLIERPWVTLSGGGDFEMFAQQVAVAMDNGCAGFMVGRALWGEAARAQGEEREALLHELVVPRFQELIAIADS